MSLRWKIALALAAITAATTIALGAASYRITRDRLLDEVDRSLVVVDAAVANRQLGRNSLPDRGPLSGLAAQVIGPDGTVRQSTFPIEVPVTEEDMELIDGRGTRFATVSAGDESYRVRTIGFRRGAVQVGRSLEETDRILASLRARTILVGVVVSALAIAIGLWISGRITASLRRLTAAAEHVEMTGRLRVTIPDEGDDEVGRLSRAFDRMLGALARSRDDQRRLVQDAGHELRTPLTSLRTNLDALRRYPDMSEADRHAILTDLHAETDELTTLVDEIVAVASGAAADEAETEFDLVDLVEDLAERFQRRTGRTIRVGGTPCRVSGHRTAVQRAVSCLLENATKFDTGHDAIDVVVTGGSVRVFDRGIGIPPDELDRVFDRFHRADAARTMPGSGLGLAIVREVAERHGGDVFVANRDGGGAEVGFGLPTVG